MRPSGSTSAFCLVRGRGGHSDETLAQREACVASKAHLRVLVLLCEMVLRTLRRKDAKLVVGEPPGAMTQAQPGTGQGPDCPPGLLNPLPGAEVT